MTKQQQLSEYERACEIARADGLIVKPVEIGEERVYVVVLPVNMSVHVVKRTDAGLACDKDCARTKFGHYCCHQAATSMFLIAEQQVETAKSVQALAEATDRLAQQNADYAIAALRRETAMLASRADNRGFSIWASR